MTQIRLDKEGKHVFDADLFSRHLHLIGTTGAGKTVCLLLILQELLFPSYQIKQPSMFIVDPLGGLSRDFLSWIVGPFCPEYVRRRVVYIEPAHTDRVMPFNPLKLNDPKEIDFRVDRAQEVILRAWGNQSIEEMPSLARWLGLTLYSLARLNLPIGFAKYMIYPDGQEFKAIRDRQDEHTIRMWREVDDLSPNQLANTLTSTRNRLQPFSSGLLGDTFSTYENMFDVERFIRERKIVIVNLAGQQRLKTQVAKAYGAFVVNQVISTIRGLSNFEVVSPTYLVLDEFQNFVTQDMVSALPEVRQLGLRLCLAHQSFSQLKKADLDLTDLVPLAQNRFVFANSFEDADLLADEFGKLTYNPHAIKHVGKSLRQIHDGYRMIEVESWSDMRSQSQSQSHGNSRSNGSGRNQGESDSIAETGRVGERRASYSNSSGQSWQDSNGESWGAATGSSIGSSHSRSQAYQPILRTFTEETSRTFWQFQEHALSYGKEIRLLKTGQSLVKLFNDDQIHRVQIRYDHFFELPRVSEKIAEFKQKNFESDYFISPAVVSQKFNILKDRLLTERIVVNTIERQPIVKGQSTKAVEGEGNDHGFG